MRPSHSALPAVRLVGHVEQQRHLLDAEVGLVQVFGEEPGQPFPGGHVVGVALEYFDAGIRRLGGLVPLHS